MTFAQTPADLRITPRNLTFGRDLKQARWWYGGRAAPSVFYDVLSLTFPKGEAFFIESVKHFRGQTQEPLTSQVAAFIAQEAIHSREHSHFNRQVEEAGYDLAAISERFNANLAKSKSRPAFINLTSTVAFEHFTAILAHAWLKDGRYFKDAPAELATLWRWHAMEEIEHKAVAYDTFNAVTKDVAPLKRWILRSRVMLRVTRLFLRNRARDMSDLFRQDGINTIGTWTRVATYLLIYPGLLRQVFLPWLDFFRPGFHPWDHDDRALLAKTSEALTATGGLATV